MNLSRLKALAQEGIAPEGARTFRKEEWMNLFAGRCPGKPEAVFIFLCQKEKPLSQASKQVDRLSQGGLSRILELGFKGKRKESELLVLPSGRWRLAVLLGVGERKGLNGEVFREAVASGLKRISGYKVSRVEVELLDPGESGLSLEEEARAAGEAFWFASYRYSEFKKPDRVFPKEVWILGADKKARDALFLAQVVGEEHCFARELVNKPGSELWPEKFAEEARRSGRRFGFKVKVYDEKALSRMGYNGIVRVGQGSRRPARLVELSYRGASVREGTIGLVGKGVTFDTGGISLKPPQGMETMKDDMTGAAVVLGVMRAAARLDLKLNLAGVIPLVENMPGGAAQRPGDIIRMADGTTVEVISTDAEGRLILADGLYHCRRLKPKQMIDIATLTGACRMALGRFAIGLMGNSEELLSRISQSGALSGERCWILPLWDDYLELLKSDAAELKNGNWGREAGTIVAGIFLKHFVGEVPWAHLDIAGTAWADEAHPYLGRGPTGKGLRLLVRYLEQVEKTR